MTPVQVGNLKIWSESHYGQYRVCIAGPKEELRFGNPNDDEAQSDAKAAILADMIRSNASSDGRDHGSETEKLRGSVSYLEEQLVVAQNDVNQANLRAAELKEKLDLLESRGRQGRT